LPHAPTEVSVCNHSNCYLSSIKGARNGFYYGSRLRFAHAFVMSILFGKGPLKDRFKWAVDMALSHGKLLAIFAFTYKTTQCILSRLLNTNSAVVSFFAGMVGSQFIIKP
jgi:peroxisomal membrane protein 4